MSTFSKRLNAARRMRGLSQSDLASKAGLQQVAISFFETGRRAPSFGNLKRLADALEVTTDYLMGRSNFAEAPMEIVSRSFGDERKLSSKDMKFLRRLVEKFIRSKNRQPLRGGPKSNNDVTFGPLFN